VQARRPRSPTATSFLMSRVLNKDSKMEVALRSALHRAGFRFRKNYSPIVGKPDIVFLKARIAIFVDGDFWHARILKEFGLDALRASLKTENQEFWLKKLQRNRSRDITVTNTLESQDWIVLRFWETDLKRDLGKALTLIGKALHKSRRATR
jgi:DNA mismatch endonuclease, patch repair protein